MKKAFDQTVRDLKREVNKKVLKVPGIEQKVLDATSNEPWGPHGSILAEIAQATRNYHEYQMIVNVIWKRISDTGKNWRHVYKGLTVLEYLVAHGSERIIDEIKEHVYQISTLSDFQYIDSSGRDQGNNVRRKSQSLVNLVNDKERIQEVRQKAAANRDKYRSTFSTRPGSGGYGDRYDDDRYSSRDEDRYGNGRERDWGYRDDDRSSRGGDPYSRDGDRYGRYSDERYGKDSYRDDDRGGSGNDDYQYGSRHRSLSRDRSFDDEDRPTRNGGGRTDDLPRDERQLDHKLSDQSIDAPPSYEEASRDAQNHVHEDRNESEFSVPALKASSASAPSASSPSRRVNQSSSPVAPAVSFPSNTTNQGTGHVPVGVPAPITNNHNDSLDEFDPRSSAPAAPLAAASIEIDLFGSASDSIYSLAVVPVTPAVVPEPDLTQNSGFGIVTTTPSSAAFPEPGENPFGDAPFKAGQENFSNQQESFAPVASFNASISAGGPDIPAAAPKIETVNSFDFDGSFGGVTYDPALNGHQSSFANPVTSIPDEPATQPTNHLVSGILGPHTGAATYIPVQETQPTAPTNVQVSLHPQSGPPALFASQPTQFSSQDTRFTAPLNSTTQINLLSQSGFQANKVELFAPTSAAPPVKSAQPVKSTVWADTLSRGLVNLNISGPKINPHADIGVDFDSINRKERMKEERKASTVPISTSTMGRAMGSGSGIGRAGAGALAAPTNPMMGSGMGMMGSGMGMMGGGVGMGMMGNGRGMGMGIGMGGGYGGGIGRPMGIGMNQGMPPQAPMGGPPGGNSMAGAGYNPMMGMGMGMGNYGSQQPYPYGGGGFR